MNNIEYTSSDRTKKCRLCWKNIPRGETCFKMTNVHVSPKIVNLFFHEQCLINSLEQAIKEKLNANQ